MRGEKTVAWQLKQAERQRSRLVKTLEWLDVQLSKLAAEIEAAKGTLHAEIDAIDGEKHVAPKIKKERKPRDPNKSRKKRVKKVALDA